MTFVFWNLNKKPLLPLLVALVRERSVDVLLLAENTSNDAELLPVVNSDPRRPTLTPPLPPHFPPKGLRIFTVLETANVQPVHDGKSVSILHLTPPIGESILLSVVHMPSKLHLEHDEQAVLTPRLIEELLQAEEQVGHTRTAVVGDFNMNPFEMGIAGSEGFHAVMTQRIAERGSRVVHGVDRRFFYNPMWNHFGDREPPGTFYDGRGRPLDYFWNMYDQVLVRPALLPRFRNEDVEIITRIAGTNLLTPSRIPNAATYSDHLPILFRLSH